METIDTIVKIDSILANTALLTAEDIEYMRQAKVRIKDIAHKRGGLDQTDKDALNRIDAIIRLYELLPKAEQD